MLGIRHYNGCAIDLWQGEREDFHCDLVVLMESNKVSSLQEVDTKSTDLNDSQETMHKNITKIFLDAEDKKKRHLAVVPKNLEESSHTLASIKNLLSQKKIGNHIKRVTLLSKDLEHYHKMQEQLFSTFP
jgi:hypothetical protein